MGWEAGGILSKVGHQRVYECSVTILMIVWPPSELEFINM